MIKKCFKEYLIEKGLLSLSLISIMIVVLLMVFMIMESVPSFYEHGFFDILLGRVWAADNNQFGVFPMIIGSLYTTLVALLLAVPLSLSCAIFLEEIAPNKIRQIFKPVIQTLAGIPSVIYGFFGLTVIVSIIRENFGGSGFSVITASIILALMILPTIISVTQDAIKSVPDYYKEASIGLGSTQWQTIKNVTLPIALPGIITAIILGVGRTIGETLAVLMVIGNVSVIPDSILSSARTLTSNIALEMGYATGIHYSALFATALILFIIIVLLMLFINYVEYKWRC